MRIIAAVAIALMFTSACTDRGKDGRLIDTPTSGYIKIAIDESLKPLMEAEIDTFEGIYKQAHIDARYMSEGEAMDALLKDSVRLIIITRMLTENESAVIKSLQIKPTQIAVAKDGIALILNKSNPDSLIQWQQLKEILEGKLTNWQQLNASSKPASLELVFDNPNSGMVRFLNDSIVHMDKIPANCFALDSNQAVVDYVAQKPNAIGLIGVSWISDGDDPSANSFLKSIRVASLSRSGEFYKPYQAYVATGEYPLQRKIYMLSREARAGLASGFISFVASDRGQRIVLKAGLVPVTMPVRIIQINRNQINN